jgi:hypothetical protein
LAGRPRGNRAISKIKVASQPAGACTFILRVIRENLGSADDLPGLPRRDLQVLLVLAECFPRSRGSVRADLAIGGSGRYLTSAIRHLHSSG